MKLAALETLVVAVARGSFAAAAVEMGITPSAVSLQMKQLEGWFGRPLFDRSGRTTRATPLARQIAASVASALTELRRFRVETVPAVAGILKLGAIPSVQTSVLPVALRLVQSAHRDLEVRLTLAISAPLLAALAAGRIDTAVVVRPKGGGSSRLVWRDLAREPFVLVAPPDTDIRTPAQLLRAYPWIRYDTSLTGGRLAAQYVQSQCHGLRPTFEVADTDAIVAMVAEGLGVSVIPRPRAAIRKGHAIREIALGARGPVRTIALACRRGDADDRRIGAVHQAFLAAYGGSDGVLR
jgi:DNA-binding transcriptional LysR family regulator